eukprot:c11504_g1_i1.p1 GENE.c11504_g1_i1~~c11504_g1_i1.p1  ORF type:complete len:107 (-),score=5.32 c11504_g1_i1:694-1014(-)
MSHQTSHHISHHISHIASRRVLNGADSSLGFILATEGYDVYLGNSRGNKDCLNHTTYSTKNIKMKWRHMTFQHLSTTFSKQPASPVSPRSAAPRVYSNVCISCEST